MIDFFALFYRLINAAEDIPSLLIASKRHIIKFVQNNIDTSNIGVLFTSATQALLTPPSGSVTEEITQLSSKLRLFTSIMIKACRAPAADPQFIKELFDTLFPVILNPVNQVSFDDLSQACFISKTILQMIEGIKKQTIEFLKKMWNSDSKIPSLEQLKSLQKEYIPNFADMPSESATGLAALFAIFTMKFGKTLLLTFNSETQSLVVKPEFQDLVTSVSEIVLNPLRAAIDSIKFSSFKELQSSIFSIENGISMDDMPELICGALEHLIGNILDSLDTTVKCTILAEVSSLPLGAPVNHFITKVFTYSGVSILKLLQLLAEKIIDESTRSMFAIFKSDLPPMPVSELREIVLNSTPVGSTWRVPDELNVDPQLCIDRPDGYLTVFIKTCGSGTISEGHFGLLSRSIDVFVKVAKEESYERFVNQESRLINAVCLDHRFASVKEPFEQIEKSFLREFDLEAEVRNIQMGYVTYHAPQKSIYVPKHLLHFTHRGRVNMIVTEKAPGVPLVSFEFVRRDCTPQQNLDRLVEVHRILSALYADFLITAFFEKGFFHGDMHAGNIMIYEEANGSKPTYKLSLIDFGNSHRLNDELTIGLLKISMGVLAHNSLCVIEGLGYNANSPDRRRIWMKVQRDLDHYFEYCDEKKIDREKYFVEKLNKSSVWTYFQEIEEVFVGEIEVCISWLPAATLTFIKGTLKNLHALVRLMKTEARYEYVPLILMEYRRLYAHISIVVRPALDTSDDEACEIIHLLNALQLYCVERMAMLRRVSLRHYQQLCLPFPCVGRFLRDLMLVSQLDRAIFEHVKGLAKREPTLVRFQQPFEPNGWVDSEYTLLKTKLLTMFPAFKFPASQNIEALTQETVETATDLDPLVALLEYVRFKHDEASNADPLFRDAAAVRAANDALATVKASCGVIRTLRFAKIHMSHFLANVSREMSAYRSLKDKVRRKVICSDIVLANHLAEARKAFLTYRRNTFAPEFRSGMAMIVVSQTPGLDMLKNDTTSVFDFFRAQKLLVDMLDGIRAKALDIDLEMKDEQFADPSAVAINANMGFGNGRGKVMRVALRNSLGLVRHSLLGMPRIYWEAMTLSVANHFSRLMSYLLADER